MYGNTLVCYPRWGEKEGDQRILSVGVVTDIYNKIWQDTLENAVVKGGSGKEWSGIKIKGPKSEILGEKLASFAKKSHALVP